MGNKGPLMTGDLKMPSGALVTYRRLVGYLRPHLKVFLVGVLGMTMFAATDAGWAAFVKFFLDGTFVDKDPRMVWLVPATLVGLFVVRGVGDFLQTYCPGWVGRRIVKTLRGQIFDRYLHLPVTFFDHQASGTLLSKLTYNTEQVANATTDSITVFIRDTLTIFGLIGYLLYLNWKLTLISLVVAPLVAALIRRINTLFRRYSRRIQNSMGDVTRVAKEAIEAPRVVRVFNAQAEVRCKARVGTWIRPGTVSLPKGLWLRHTANGLTANALVPDTLTDLGAGACFNDARVQVGPVPH